MIKAIEETIKSLNEEPHRWRKGNHTLIRDDDVQIWTSNIPYLNCGLYHPNIPTGFIDGILLQLAVNYWYKNSPLKGYENE